MAKPDIYIADTGDRGRGVFTRKKIKAGDIVESAPVIVMSHEDRLHIDQTILQNYIFEWQPEGQNMCCMALGTIPMYNHDYESNCEYYMEYEEMTMFVQAVRDIEAGEELTVNYNGTWNDGSRVWFDAREEAEG
ncbi:SET domain-containing protein-lysine N-methyltransferase [Nemorincola caseinilytica]|uniref:SET domain-containing protein-lysine N-methyltransferase n=1 Tax=Nemorincola caseinilytica TaxID=2054315 RepID=A0ABP8NL66_9BACT